MQLFSLKVGFLAGQFKTGFPRFALLPKASNPSQRILNHCQNYPEDENVSLKKGFIMCYFFEKDKNSIPQDRKDKYVSHIVLSIEMQ